MLQQTEILLWTQDPVFLMTHRCVDLNSCLVDGFGISGVEGIHRPSLPSGLSLQLSAPRLLYLIYLLPDSLQNPPTPIYSSCLVGPQLSWLFNDTHLDSVSLVALCSSTRGITKVTLGL